jgi:hypothetical protein
MRNKHHPNHSWSHARMIDVPSYKKIIMEANFLLFTQRLDPLLVSIHFYVMIVWIVGSRKITTSTTRT